MVRQFSAVGQGLMKVFFGACLSAAYVLLNTTGLLLGLMPLRILSAVVCLAGFFLAYVGLTAAAVAESGYRRAIWCERLSAVAGLLAALLMDNPLLILALALFRQCMDLIGIVVVCRVSGQLMTEQHGESYDGRGALTWKLSLLCGVGAGVCGCVSVIFLNEKLLLAAVTFYLILQILERLVYMIFLYRSHNVFQSR